MSHVISDAYTLNATRHRITVCPYTNFPILEVELDFSTHITPQTIVRGSHAFAISRHSILFASGYNEPSNLFYLGKRTLDGLKAERKLVATAPPSFAELDFSAGRFSGRGNAMHWLGPEGWFTARIKD